MARLLLHGAPQVGKTSVKRLIFNYPPLAKEDEQSTQLIEDPVRAISTHRMISTDEKNLEEVDETKLILMIQIELKSRLSQIKTEKKSPAKTGSTDYKSANINVRHPSSGSSGVSQKKFTMPEILADIAKDLDSINPNSAPPLFECQFVHLVDSGGQPQYSDLLPLVFQSQSHSHIVVIPLNERLHQKPRNCLNAGGHKIEFPESLLLTHFQLIERVCQLAKASESKSKVIVVGTHLDKENEEEPLTKKNQLLKSLINKYQDTLVANESGNIVFALNAMEPVGKMRTKYAAMLQVTILDFCCHNIGREMPLCWMALELELSRRSREAGDIVQTSECDEVATSLGVKDLCGALTFFTELAIHYHYQEAVPDIVFTSVGAISSRLSTIVERSFILNTQDKDARLLQKSGKLTKAYLEELLSKIQSNEHFTSEDFLKIIMHLRIAFPIDDHTLLIPSLLPVDSTEDKLDCYHSEPLAFYWYDDEYQEVRILPQSFFHALIVDLLRKKESIRLSKSEQTRSNIVLTLTLENKKKCMIRLVSRAFWMEAFAERQTFTSDDIFLLNEIIQNSSQSVLHQLKLARIFGSLQCGLLCPNKKCGIKLPHLCASIGMNSVLMCLEDEHSKWEEEDHARLFWMNFLQEKGVFIMKIIFLCLNVY